MKKEKFITYFIETVSGVSKTDFNSKIITNAYEAGVLFPVTYYNDFITFKTFEFLIQRRLFDYFNWQTESITKNLLDLTHTFETFLILNRKSNSIIKPNNDCNTAIDCLYRLYSYKDLIYKYCGVNNSFLLNGSIITFIEANNHISKLMLEFDYLKIQNALVIFLNNHYSKEFTSTEISSESKENIEKIINQFDDELIDKISENFIGIIYTCQSIKIKINNSFIDASINENYTPINLPNNISTDELINLYINIETIEKRFGEELSKSIKRKISAFLNEEVKKVKGSAGFFKVKEDLSNVSEALYEAEDKIVVFEKIVDKFRVVSKINQILESINEFGGNQKEIVEKIVNSVIASPDTNFFSSLFELYIYLIFLKYNVEMEFLPEAIGERRCDFIFKNNLIADSKCLSGTLDSFDTVVKKYYEDIIDQIVQTKADAQYSNAIGGSILGFYDNNYEFLQSLKNYYYQSINNKIETIAEFIICLNSELRKYNVDGRNISFEKDMKDLKFILFYYVPNCTINDDIKTKINNKEEFNDYELFFLFVTENASYNEFIKIKEVFKSLCPVIFKFPSKFDHETKEQHVNN